MTARYVSSYFEVDMISCCVDIQGIKNNMMFMDALSSVKKLGSAIFLPFFRPISRPFLTNFKISEKNFKSA